MSLQKVGTGSFTFEGATRWYKNKQKALDALKKYQLQTVTDTGGQKTEENASETPDMTQEEFDKLQSETVAKWEQEQQDRIDAANLQLIADLREQVSILAASTAVMKGDVGATSEEIDLIRQQLALEQAKVDELKKINEGMTESAVDSSGQLMSTIEDLEQSIRDMERARAASEETEKIINAMDNGTDPMMIIGGAVAVIVILIGLVVIAEIVN